MKFTSVQGALPHLNPSDEIVGPLKLVAISESGFVAQASNMQGVQQLHFPNFFWSYERYTASGKAYGDCLNLE